MDLKSIAILYLLLGHLLLFYVIGTKDFKEVTRNNTGIAKILLAILSVAFWPFLFIGLIEDAIKYFRNK